MKSSWCATILVAGHVIAAPGWSQPADLPEPVSRTIPAGEPLPTIEAPFLLGEIVVGARRPTVGAVTEQRILQSEVARQDPRNLVDLGRTIPAVTAPTNSRGETFFYVRGAGERQVALFFDGAPLQVPWDYAIDTSLVPAAMVGSMTVAKGASSVLWGANGVGGSVNLLGRADARPGTHADFSAFGGTSQRLGGAAAATSNHGAWHLAGALGWVQHGNVALPSTARPDVRATPHSNPQVTERNNTDGRGFNALVRASRDLPGEARVALTLLHLDSAKGAPVEGHKDPADPAFAALRFWRYPLWEHSLAIASYFLPLDAGMGEVRATAWAQRFAQSIDSYTDASFAPAGRKASQHDLDGSLGARLAVQRAAGPGTLRGALSELVANHDQVDADVSAGTETAKPNQHFAQHIASAGAEYEWQAAARLVVKAGAGYDTVIMTDIDKFGTLTAPPDFGDWSGNLGATLTLQPGLYLRASAGHKSRFPTQRELYGAALNKFAPNPHLQPESNALGEVGLAYSGAQVECELTGFATLTRATLDKRKVTVQETDPAGAVTNVKKDQRYNLAGGVRFGLADIASSVLGVEALARLRPWRHVALTGHGAVMAIDAYDPARQDFTKHLERRPSAVATLTGAWEPPTGFTGLLQASLIGPAWSFNLGDALERLDPYALVNARASYVVRYGADAARTLEVYGRIDNALNTLALPSFGLPEPGRSLQGGVRALF
ncbi:MAG: TonB-dependent receptor [Myxococcales bacterium]|nr:TonB-dependent receptor [Myxococcales bacterium]